MSHQRKQESQRRVEDEIRREKAAALGRAGERLESALREARALVLRLEVAAAPAERERLLEEYERVRRRAQEARWALLIQREAIGLRNHAVVEQLFPEPPRRTRS